MAKHWVRLLPTSDKSGELAVLARKIELIGKKRKGFLSLSVS